MIDFKKHPIEIINPRPLKHASHKLQHLIKDKLWMKVIVSIFFGALVGFLLNPATGFVEKEIALLIGEWLALPGNIFLALVQMIVIPLIFASIIRGIAASENVEQLKKSGLFIVSYFILTTVIAIVIGITIVSIIEPGQYVSLSGFTDIEIDTPSINSSENMSLPNQIVQIIPTNLFSAVLNTQFLQIIIFSIIFGIALVNMNPEQSKPLLELLGSLQTVSMTIIKWSMILVPLAVFGFMTRSIIQFGFDVLVGMSAYVITIILGLATMLIFYLTIVYFVARIKPLDFMKRIRDLQLLAFSTSSSAAVMPISMKTAEEKFNVRSSISQFIIPIGATINMDGTAIYQTIATIFLAQVFGVDLTLTGILLIVVTVVGSSIGAPGTPGVGIIILSAILTSIGVPLAGIALIIGFDRILDMLRTAVNVTGDITASIVLNKLIKSDKTIKDLKKEEKKFENIRKKKNHDVVLNLAA
jgi:Na+/H+-dicarboxylate symporter